MKKAGRADLNPVRKRASSHFKEGRTRGLPDFLKVNLKRIRPFHDTARYGYAVGRVRVLEMQMLNASRVERLVEADFEGALYILEEMAMGDYLEGAHTAKDVEAGLSAFLRDTYASLEEALPPDSFLMDFFLCRYDFHNLKALLKADLEGTEPQGLLTGLGRLDISLLAKGMEEPGVLPSSYKETVEELADTKGTPQELDTLVDRHYLEHRLFLAKRENSPFMIDFARASIDLANLKQVLRGRNLGKEVGFLQGALADGGFIQASDLRDLYGDLPEVMMKKLEASVYYSKLLGLLEDTEEMMQLTDFDRRSDDHLMDMVRGTKRVAVGVEPVFAYLRARENEALMVRMILIAKLHNIPPAAIDRTLRKLYME